MYLKGFVPILHKNPNHSESSFRKTTELHKNLVLKITTQLEKNYEAAIKIFSAQKWLFYDDDKWKLMMTHANVTRDKQE